MSKRKSNTLLSYFNKKTPERPEQIPILNDVSIKHDSYYLLHLLKQIGNY